MQKSDTTMNDIAESIADLANMMAADSQGIRQEMADGFTSVRQEMADGFSEVNERLVKLEAGQRETNERLVRIEGDGKAHEADIKELYTMIDQIRGSLKTFTKQERYRFAELEAFAMQVAEKTGIPFSPGNPGSKSKLRS